MRNNWRIKYICKPIGNVFGIKYVIDTKGSQRYATTYEKLEGIKSEKYEVYKNPYALSIAYGVNSELKDLKFKDKNNSVIHSTFFERYNDLMRKMVGNVAQAQVFFRFA